MKVFLLSLFLSASFAFSSDQVCLELEESGANSETAKRVLTHIFGQIQIIQNGKHSHYDNVQASISLEGYYKPSTTSIDVVREYGNATGLWFLDFFSRPTDEVNFKFDQSEEFEKITNMYCSSKNLIIEVEVNEKGNEYYGGSRSRFERVSISLDLIGSGMYHLKVENYGALGRVFPFLRKSYGILN